MATFKAVVNYGVQRPIEPKGHQPVDSCIGSSSIYGGQWPLNANLARQDVSPFVRKGSGLAQDYLRSIYASDGAQPNLRP